MIRAWDPDHFSFMRNRGRSEGTELRNFSTFSLSNIQLKVVTNKQQLKRFVKNRNRAVLLKQRSCQTTTYC